MPLHNFWSALVLQRCCQTILFCAPFAYNTVGHWCPSPHNFVPPSHLHIVLLSQMAFSNKSSICALKILFGAKKQC